MLYFVAVGTEGIFLSLKEKGKENIMGSKYYGSTVDPCCRF
jgi:hypothetical protein